MRLELDAYGDTQFAREILRVGDRAADMRPAFDDIRDMLLGVERKQFNSQGRAFSGGWAPLAPLTVKRKAARNLDPRILHATLRLRKSFTEKGHRDNVYRKTKDEMFFGSRVPYGGYHQHGNPDTNLPQRRPFQLNERTRREVIKILQRHLVDEGAF